MNDDSEYRIALTFAPGFESTKPLAAELGLLEAMLPELMTALLDAAPDVED